MKGAYGTWVGSEKLLRFTNSCDETQSDTIMNVYERSRATATAADRDMIINISENFDSLDVSSLFTIDCNEWSAYMIEACHESSHPERRMPELTELTHPNADFNSLTDVVAR
jgi:hypothetical protein